jgi:hypothetical protein
MRKSRVLLAGVAVAAAAAATSAFTASNDFSAVTKNVAGYQEATVTGATVTKIAYTPGTDPSTLAAVVFTTSNDVTGATATMNLLNGSTAATGGTNTCAAPTATTITCTLGTAMPFANFNKVGLTVVNQ